MDTQGLNHNQVIHVRGDSDSDLEELFKVLNSNSPTNNGSNNRPFRERKLPASFFKPPDPQKGNHSREGSSDSTHNYLGPPAGPPPSSISKTGLQIAHPRAHSSPASLQQTLAAASQQQTQHVRQQSLHLTTSSDPDEAPLPPCWEMAKTPNGQRYFLNHLDQTTTWHDPRKSHSTTALNQSNPQALGPLPPGWEQATSPDGEVYFINHVEKATSWFDPRLSLRPNVRMMANSPQTSPQLQQQLQQQPRQMSPSDRQRHLQLQKLQMEKERLRQRQEEIARQEMMLAGTIQEETPMSPASTAELSVPVSTSGVDPFLSQGGTQDFHARQESADSGLGGMSYSLPRTPEDFLSNVEEMEAQDGGQKLQQSVQQHRAQGGGGSEFNMDLQGNVDLTDLGENETSNMDSDDLVPSIQDDISNELLLNDMESVFNTNKMENLLWL